MSNKRVNPFKLKLHLLECEADEKDKKISDLEARLAESEADKKALISDYESRITKHQELMSWLEHDNGQLKQQLHELPKKIVSEIKDCLLDFSNGWWRYFMTDGCEYMLSSDLQGCLDETIDTILKKYGEEDE